MMEARQISLHWQRFVGRNSANKCR